MGHERALAKLGESGMLRPPRETCHQNSRLLILWPASLISPLFEWKPVSFPIHSQGMSLA